jgi:CDP-diacylglycerol--glycerol-3-phosphate 3-phosphatidyltransferase
MADWKSTAQQWVYRWINPFIRWCLRAGITPNGITLTGLFINVIAAGIFIYGGEYSSRNDHSIVGVASAVILFAGLFDMIDGRLARVGGLDSKYGALYDSVLDRYSEMIMFLGICYYLVAHHYFLSSLFAFVGMIGSVMVSYTRARAEGLGLKMADVGFMQRPERILLIGLSGVICGLYSVFINAEMKIVVNFLPFPLIETITLFTFPIFLLAVFSNMTAISRLRHAEKELRQTSNSSHIT